MSRRVRYKPYSKPGTGVLNAAGVELGDWEAIVPVGEEHRKDWEPTDVGDQRLSLRPRSEADE